MRKDTKKHELRKKNFQKFQKLKLHKLISLNLHHLCGTLTILIWRWFSKFTPLKWVSIKQFWCVICSRKSKRVEFFNPRVKKWILKLQRIKILSGFQFENDVLVNQIHLYDYSSIWNCVWECHFHVFGGKLPNSLHNVTPLPKRSPTPLLLVEEKY